MATLSLSQSDQTRVTNVVEALLSPLDFADEFEWRRNVNRLVQPLIGADVVTFVLAVGGRADTFSEQRANEVRKYAGYMRSEEVDKAFHARVRRLRVVTREAAWGRDITHLRQTRYWNEFVRPLRLYDSLTMCVPTGPRLQLEDTAQIIFNHDHPSRVGFREREVALARLMYPALKAGVRSWMSLRGSSGSFAVGIDDLRAPVAVFDVGGQLLHLNIALRDLLQGDPGADDVMAACRSMVQSHRELNFDSMAASGLNTIAGRTVRTPAGRYVLHVARIGPGVSSYREAIAVTIRRDSERLMTEADAIARFGFTKRQATVALLLAERKTSVEIANTLCISTHTARHHTEAVMDKLGVQDRRDVRSKLTV